MSKSANKSGMKGGVWNGANTSDLYNALNINDI